MINEKMNSLVLKFYLKLKGIKLISAGYENMNPKCLLLTKDQFR